MPAKHEDDARFDALGATVTNRFRTLPESLRPAAMRAVESARLPLDEGRKLVNAKALESSVQSAITDYLTAQRIPFARTDATESFNRKGQRVCRVNEGWPDLTACYASYLVAIECKRAIGGTLTFEQADCLHRLHQAGALVVVARSVDDLIALLVTKRTSAATVAEIVAALKKGPKLKRRSR
jgi:hypothetical protein